MKNVVLYLRGRVGFIILQAAFAAIFAVSFALYHLPIAAVAYPALLCLCLLIVCAAIGVIRQRSRHRRLSHLSSLPADMISELPEPRSVDERDYQAIIYKLRDDMAALDGDRTARLRDTIEYYTVWAHQIKTPITSMRLALENEDTPLGRELTTDLHAIERYVGMVLAYLRLDSESSDYVFKKCSLDDIIGGAVSELASEFISRRISLDYDRVGMEVVTDEKWLSFVIGQVLSNALKYTPQGSVSIYASGEDTLCIEDTGIGIEESDLPRIFEKGYTGCNGRIDKRSTGIGLYLCRRVCDRLGASITAESEVGRGTRIFIRFDRRADAA